MQLSQKYFLEYMRLSDKYAITGKLNDYISKNMYFDLYLLMLFRELSLNHYFN